jgi:hypothetical protein
MKIAVVQHCLRANGNEDALALSAAVSSAASRGASLVILPHVASLSANGGTGERLLGEALENIPVLCIVPRLSDESTSLSLVVELPAPADGGDPLGKALLAIGDACFDTAGLQKAVSADLDIAVLAPMNQTDLQAEAMLEHAIALSDSLAGVVVIAECAGADALEAGHGGSAIVMLGEVLAEAFSGDSLLLAELSVPFPAPEPREPLPPVPPLLAQRMDRHKGSLLEEHGPDLS